MRTLTDRNVTQSVGTNRVYGTFVTKHGKGVLLRGLEWKDLDNLVLFINSIVKEKQMDPKSELGIGFDRELSREEEAEWVLERLAQIGKGNFTSILAELDGAIAANGGIERGNYSDTNRFGHVGLTVRKEYRGMGIGREITRTLIGESRKAGFKTLGLEMPEDSVRSIRIYKKSGFREVGRIPKKIFRNGKFLDSVVLAAEL